MIRPQMCNAAKDVAREAMEAVASLTDAEYRVLSIQKDPVAVNHLAKRFLLDAVARLLAEEK